MAPVAANPTCSWRSGRRGAARGSGGFFTTPCADATCSQRSCRRGAGCESGEEFSSALVAAQRACAWREWRSAAAGCLTAGTEGTITASSRFHNGASSCGRVAAPAQPGAVTAAKQRMISHLFIICPPNHAPLLAQITLWSCGRREEAPSTTPQGQQQKRQSKAVFVQPTQDSKEAILVRRPTLANIERAC